MTIRTVVADDEPLARERIVTLLRDEPDVELVAECQDGASAVDAIRRLSPDLVFLDSQMPAGDGFGVIEGLNGERLPMVIFVTACDAHALRAFDVHALDCLLKPVDGDRFRRALDRAREVLAQRRAERGARRPRIVVRGNGRVFFLPTRDIDWIEAAGNYLKLHVNGDGHMIRQTMAAMEAQLDAETFVRIHRSAIVNIDRIKELQPLFNGEYLVILESGARLTLSRGYREKLEAMLGHDL